MKGKFESGKKGLWLRRFLVTIQFIATFIMIVGIIIVVNQLSFTLNKDKGFDDSQIMNIRMNTQDISANYEALKSELEQIPDIKMIASSSSLPGLGFGSTGALPEGAKEDDNWIVSILSMDENTIPLLDMEIAEGENFRQDMSAEANPVIVNESFVKTAGWESALNKTITQRNRENIVIGVVKDFHFTSMRHQIEPIMMTYRAGGNRILSLKINESSIKETISKIENVWNEINEGTPFEYDFMMSDFVTYLKKKRTFPECFSGLLYFRYLWQCWVYLVYQLFRLNKGPKK